MFIPTNQVYVSRRSVMHSWHKRSKQKSRSKVQLLMAIKLLGNRCLLNNQPMRQWVTASVELNCQSSSKFAHAEKLPQMCLKPLHMPSSLAVNHAGKEAQK